MAFTTKLFRIVISNSYYKSNVVQNDFDVIPIPSTVAWMEQRRVRILHHPDGIELIWLSQGYDHPLELFKAKADGITLSFVMTLKNTQALNLSELEPGYSIGKVYYLYNRRANTNHLLHGKAFMGGSDFVKIQDLAHYPTQPGWNVFAMIDINLTHWTYALSKQKSVFAQEPLVYKIKIQGRSTFWRYYLVDTKNRFNGTLRILCKGDGSYFGEVKPSAKFPNAYAVESNLPMELSDQYDHFFSLCKLEKSSSKGETILLEKLPYPTYDSLKKDEADAKKRYSDIVVYV